MFDLLGAEVGFKIRDKDQGAQRGSAETQILSSAKMARMARVDNVFRHIERQARQLIREDIGRGHTITYQNASSDQTPQATVRVVDRKNPDAICPYMIFKVDDSEHRAVLQIFTKHSRKSFELANDVVFADIRATIDANFTDFVTESRNSVRDRNIIRDAALHEVIGDEVVAIEVDGRINLTDEEARDVRKMLGGIMGENPEVAKPIVVDHDFNLEGNELPTADSAWHETEGGEEAEVTTRIFTRKKATVIANRYELKKLLGTGGMGAVFVAEDRQTGNTVALKMLHPTLADDQVVLRRFFREVQLIQQVDHPNVIRTIESGSYERVVYYTMEFVRGMPLNKLVQGRKLRADALYTFGIQLAEGLKAIHDANIIHRDLKGENVIVTKDKQIKIIDFGIARTEDSNLTSMGEVIGSPAYLAPELWRGEVPTSASDLYALGVIFYRMAYGVLPFKGDNPVAVMNKHLHETPEFGKDTVSAAPAWFLKMVDALLKKEPEKRPTLDKVIKQLQQAIKAG